MSSQSMIINTTTEADDFEIVDQQAVDCCTELVTNFLLILRVRHISNVPQRKSCEKSLANMLRRKSRVRR